MSTALLAVVGWKLQPMLERYNDLQHQIVVLDNQIAGKRQTLDQLESLIRTSPDTKFKERANKIIAGSALKDYTIAIYYLSSDESLPDRAAKLNRKLLDANLGAAIKVFPKDQEFLRTITAPDSDEIRFRPVDEDQGKALLETLKALDPEHSYKLRPVSGKISNFVSIFLKSNKFHGRGK